ncbi:MAG: Hsp20 family protein [Gammaproteobacteria bacterium]|nr:Hsp20 family protein [Gammaproteobacteria bacterium]
MKTIDLTPLYRSSIGYDHLASLLDNMFRADSALPGYPPYDIEMVDENRYAITLAVAGFTEDELNIQVERGVLTVRGEKAAGVEKRNYLYQGIASRTFERKFNLAEYVEVTGAKLSNGLLTIGLKREVPETMKPKRIAISSDEHSVIGHKPEAVKASKAA